ncbi:MAG: hypothetical protein QG577_2261 [Thermodesulfobacteriota bacterium]|nr:hypothetical protein [Thermodesulfobacteriota bacterium]
MHERLTQRTSLFRTVQRGPDAIQDFGQTVRALEGNHNLDSEIHVCPYVGFVDGRHACIGCMLHPVAPGNEGKDLRGLCYYGSLACKTFYCDSWRSLPLHCQSILADLIDDWHLWGLVATDRDFVVLLFSLLENMLGCSIDDRVTRDTKTKSLLITMLNWKDSWPPAHGYLQRKSRYYVSPQFMKPEQDPNTIIIALIPCIDFTYGTSTSFSDGAHIIRSAAHNFIEAYRSGP